MYSQNEPVGGTPEPEAPGPVLGPALREAPVRTPVFFGFAPLFLFCLSAALAVLPNTKDAKHPPNLHTRNLQPIRGFFFFFPGHCVQLLSFFFIAAAFGNFSSATAFNYFLFFRSHESPTQMFFSRKNRKNRKNTHLPSHPLYKFFCFPCHVSPTVSTNAPLVSRSRRRDDARRRCGRSDEHGSGGGGDDGGDGHQGRANGSEEPEAAGRAPQERPQVHQVQRVPQDG